MNVRRPPGIVVISPGIFARPNCDKSVAPVGIRYGMPATGEVRIQRSVVLIDAVEIAPRSICLPDFHERVRHRSGVLIKHAPTHDNPLAERLAGMLPR